MAPMTIAAIVQLNLRVRETVGIAEFTRVNRHVFGQSWQGLSVIILTNIIR